MGREKYLKNVSKYKLNLIYCYVDQSKIAIIVKIFREGNYFFSLSIFKVTGLFLKYTASKYIFYLIFKND